MPGEEIARKVEEVEASLVEPIEENVREMSEEEFNMLVKSIEENGFAEPIQVVEKCGGGYKIVNGNHRYQALTRVFGLERVPVVVLGRLCCEDEKPEEAGCWDEIRYWSEVFRLNNIRGEWVKPEVAKKITKLWEHYRARGFTLAEFKERLGFKSKDKTVDRIIERVKKVLPDDLREKLEKKRAEAGAVDELLAVVRDILREAGESQLKHGYVAFTMGGRQHIMIRATPELWAEVNALIEEAKKTDRSVADIIYERLRRGASH